MVKYIINQTNKENRLLAWQITHHIQLPLNIGHAKSETQCVVFSNRKPKTQFKEIKKEPVNIIARELHLPSAYLCFNELLASTQELMYSNLIRNFFFIYLHYPESYITSIQSVTWQPEGWPDSSSLTKLLWLVRFQFTDYSHASKIIPDNVKNVLAVIQ